MSSFGVDPQHVQRNRRRNAESLALADCKAMHAAMRAELMTALIDDGSAAYDRGLFPLDEGRLIAVRNETDFLAVGLIRDGEPEPACLAAYLGLGERSNGKHRPRELILRQ